MEQIEHEEEKIKTSPETTIQQEGKARTDDEQVVISKDISLNEETGIRKSDSSISSGSGSPELKEEHDGERLEEGELQGHLEEMEASLSNSCEKETKEDKSEKEPLIDEKSADSREEEEEMKAEKEKSCEEFNDGERDKDENQHHKPLNNDEIVEENGQGFQDQESEAKIKETKIIKDKQSEIKDEVAHEKSTIGAFIQDLLQNLFGKLNLKAYSKDE